MPSSRPAVAALAALTLLFATAGAVHADGTLGNVNHVVIVMMENHSFDNYFGVLPYATGSPYHGGPCAPTDHTCVDGLSCTRDMSGNYACTNSNLDDDASMPTAFHEASYCTGPDLDHSWKGSHQEVNYSSPAGALLFSPMDGFVRVNDATEQIDNGESPTDDDTIGFYNENDLPFYYAIAQSFAISDRYFCSVIGQTFPNRSYEMAATSFGHLTTAEIIPPIPNPYKPITGTIFDLLDTAGVSWKNYYNDLPTSAIFRFPPSPNAVAIANFFTDAAAGTLPQVSFIDPSLTGPNENDEHPPTDIRKGQFFVWQVINAVRTGLNWSDTVIFFTYDEHGGFYDHAAPPPAPQGGNLNPDGINPGQCADNSNPPASTQPGGGVQCNASHTEAAAICPGFTPTGPYPASCANFDQLGIRVPFVAISPFSKPAYVSHTVGDHTSLLAFIEKRFLASQFLTARDQNAATLEDMFDFDNSPSLNTTVPTAPAPLPNDPGCPYTTTTTTLVIPTTTTTTTSTTTTTLEDTGFVPPNSTTGKCEDRAAKTLAKYMAAVVKCHVKSADSGVKGTPLDDESCESNPSTGKGAKEKYDAAIAKLVAKGCGGCATTNAPGLRAAAESFLENNNGQIYCAGSTPFQGGDDTGSVPPDAATAKCEDGVAKTLSKYLASVIKCHIKAADSGVKGGSHEDEPCESNPSTGKGAKEKYDAAIAKLVGRGCGGCAITNAPSLRTSAAAFLDANNGQTYCAGTVPF